MSLPRYVKSPEQLAQLSEKQVDALDSTVQQVIVEYKTDPELAKAIVPEPLVVDPDGIIRVVLSNVVMHLGEGFDMEIGSGVFAVKASYKGQSGYYIVTMPMTTEAAVIGGRETYGEPKKIADIAFANDNGQITSSITRHGMSYIEFKGNIGDETPAQDIEDKMYCYKIFPSPSGEGFDSDPLLVQLNISRRQKQSFKLEGELVLNESPVDPVADLPIREIVSMVYEIVDTESNGEVLQSVAQEKLYAFVHQRYDDFSALLGG